MIASHAPLHPGCPGVLVQVPMSKVDLAARFLPDDGLGAVLTLGSNGVAGNRAQRTTALVGHYRTSGGDPTALLVDANRYSGKNRDMGERDLTRDWVTHQHALGLPTALTDSPYIPEGDSAALRRVLEQAALLPVPVVAVLPLHVSWMNKHRDSLIGEVNRVGVPVGLIIEHSGDPYGSVRSVRGLLDVLDEASVPVLVLRSDVSALGAVACGATAGAIGSSTALRHLYPMTTGGGGSSPRIGAFHPAGMSYRALDTLTDAMAADPDPPPYRWTCECRFCNTGSIVDYVVDEDSATRHSFAGLGLLARSVMAPNALMSQTRSTWTSKVGHAQFDNLEIASSVTTSWRDPGFLGAWHDALSRYEPEFSTT